MKSDVAEPQRADSKARNPQADGSLARIFDYGLQFLDDAAVQFDDLDLAGLEPDVEVARGAVAAGVEEPYEERAVSLEHRRHCPPGLARVDERALEALAAA